MPSLQEAHAVTKSSRNELVNALAEVKANMVITTKQRQKQGLEQMLEVLQQLREAAHLHDALRCTLFGMNAVWHAIFHSLAGLQSLH